MKNARTILMAALACGLLGFLVWVYGPTPRMTSTSLPSPQALDAPGVGPLTLDPGARLSVVTPEFAAEFDASGQGHILRVETSSGATTIPMPVATGTRPGTSAIAPSPVEHTLALDDATCSRLFQDLGRLRASWSARTAGEAAATDLTGGATDTARPAIIIEEIRADRSTHLLLRIGHGAPEYDAVSKALTPLRMEP